MKQHITAIIPCFNEEKSIKDIVSKVKKYCDNIIIIDDASSDKSPEILESIKDDSNINVSVFRNNKNKGIGFSVKRGLYEALKLKTDIIIKIDGDGQHLPEDIPIFLDKINNENFDFVKGNRFLLKKNLKNMPFKKLLGNLIVTNLQKLISGNYFISDPNNGFLAFKREIFDAIDIEFLQNNYFFENSLLISASAHNFYIGEVGIDTIYSDEKSSIPMIRASIKTLPTFLKLLFLKNIISARYNLSINSILFFLFWPILLINLIYNLISLWVVLVFIVVVYVMVDLLNYFNNKKI